MKKPTLLLAAGLGIMAARCGANHVTSPTAASAGPAVTSVDVYGPRVVLVGTSVTYSSVMSFGSGASATNLRPTVWSSDDASVATMRSASDGIGELTAHRPGRVTIAAAYSNTSGSLPIEVRDPNQQTGGAHLDVTFTPDPATGSQARCNDPFPPPTWRFTELIAETAGIGFKVELATIALYSENGSQIYLATDPEEYYFPPNSVFEEEACMSLGGSPGGYYQDGFNGVDDRGEQLAFSSRLRLLPLVAPAQAPTLLTITPRTGVTIKRTLRRVR